MSTGVHQLCEKRNLQGVIQDWIPAGMTKRKEYFVIHGEGRNPETPIE